MVAFPADVYNEAIRVFGKPLVGELAKIYPDKLKSIENLQKMTKDEALDFYSKSIWGAHYDANPGKLDEAALDMVTRTEHLVPAPARNSTTFPAPSQEES